MSFVVLNFIALLAGAAHALSLAWPSTGQALWWLQILSLSVLCAGLLRTQSLKQAALLSGTFAWASLAAALWWLFISMHRYGGLAAPLAAGAVGALAAFLSIYYVLAAVLWHRLRGSKNSKSSKNSCLIFAALWLAADLARGQLFTGFAWGAGGYAHIDSPLAAFAPWVGVYGIGAAAAAVSMLIAQLFVVRGLTRDKIKALLGLALLAVLSISAQHFQERRSTNPEYASGEFRVALLQGNIPQDEKFELSSGIPDALLWYGGQLLNADDELIVAPETAIPLLPQQLMQGYLPQLRQHFLLPKDSERAPAALVGIPLGDEFEGYTNSVLGWASEHKDRFEGNDYRYDKHHLVPFGEFIPPMFKWFTRMMRIPLGDFERGSLQQAPLEWRGERISPNICYEDLFGEELAVRFLASSQAPTVLVNISNLAWFGQGQAIEQHLNISRMRTLELERPMLRATNTGATAIIDHRGRVLERLPSAERGVLRGSIQGRTSISFYAYWTGRWGLWPMWIASLLGVLLAAFPLPAFTLLAAKRR